MTTEKMLKEIINLCENRESDIDIDKAVNEDDNYLIGIWDLIQQIKEITGKKKND